MGQRVSVPILTDFLPSVESHASLKKSCISGNRLDWDFTRLNRSNYRFTVGESFREYPHRFNISAFTVSTSPFTRTLTDLASLAEIR